MIEIRCIICDELVGFMSDEKKDKIKPCCCTNPSCERVFRTVTVQ